MLRESDALARVLCHRWCGRSLWNRGPAGWQRPLAGGRARAGATSCRRNAEASKQHVHGRQQGLQEADRAEGRAPIGGKVYLVGVWAGGDQSWFEFQWSARGREKESLEKGTQKQLKSFWKHLSTVKYYNGWIKWFHLLHISCFKKRKKKGQKQLRTQLEDNVHLIGHFDQACFSTVNTCLDKPIYSWEAWTKF